MKRLKSINSSSSRYYLVLVDDNSIHANMLKDKVISNMKNLLEIDFIYVSPEFPINKTLKILTIILDKKVFAYGDVYWNKLVGMVIGTLISCIVTLLFFVCHAINNILPLCAK